MNASVQSIIRAFLIGQTVLTDVVDERIMSPRLQEDTDLPAIGFFVRGGINNPHIEEMVNPSVQFDCWADSAIGADEVYRALFDVLQGVQNQVVTVDGSDYALKTAVQEVQGQDLPDVEIPNYYRVLTFFSIMIAPVPI